jgi:hypothetical protein
VSPVKSFAELSEQEVMALAISNEDEDSRIYRSFADALRQSYPDTAEMYMTCCSISTARNSAISCR